MFDFLPWMDEVHIVEMGRIFSSSGNDATTILTTASGSPFFPMYYLGPFIHDFAFRIGGAIAVRLIPWFGLALTALAFTSFLRSSKRYNNTTVAIMAAIAVTLPLFIQSIRQVRVDMLAIASIFLACKFIAERKTCFSAAFAVISCFIWPSSILCFPLLLALVIENKIKPKSIILAITTGTIVAAILLIPIANNITATISAFFDYFSAPSSATEKSLLQRAYILLFNTSILLTKEFLRAPFFFLLLPLGLFTLVQKRIIMSTALFVAFAAGLYSGMHTFRFIFIMPYLLIAVVEAVESIYVSYRRFAITAGILTTTYGILCGPIAYATIGDHTTYNHLTKRIQKHLDNIPTNATIFTPGYSIYYLLRERGFKQIAIGDLPGYLTSERIDEILSHADYAIIEKENYYSAVEENYTLYGIIRDYCLKTAEMESKRINKSFFAKIGESFHYPIKDDFSKALESHEFKFFGSFKNIDGRNYSFWGK